MKKSYSITYNQEANYINIFEKLDDENGSIRENIYSLGVEDLHSINFETVVLSIIKKFKVNVGWFKHSIKVTPNDTQALAMYNLGCNYGNSITKDEFDILKGWLNA